VSLHGQDGVIARATLPGWAADAQLWSVEVPEGAGAWLGREPGWVQFQGWGGVLHHIVVAVEAAQSLGDGDVPGAVVFVVRQVERILFALRGSIICKSTGVSTDICSVYSIPPYIHTSGSNGFESEFFLELKFSC